MFLFNALFSETIFYNILRLLLFPTHFDFTGNHSVCLLQRGTQDNKGQSRVLFTVHKSSVWLYIQWCVEVARQWGRLVEKNCLSMCFKWTHTHILNCLISSAQCYLYCCALWSGGMAGSSPLHPYIIKARLMSCKLAMAQLVSCFLPSLWLYCILTVLNYWLHTCPA